MKIAIFATVRSSSRFRVRASLVVVPLLGLLPAAAGPARAHTQPKAKVAFHVQPHARKSIGTCRIPADGGRSPLDVPCVALEPYGYDHVGYDAYLIVVGARPGPGLGGVQCGVAYDGRVAKGIDVFGWEPCVDQEYRGTGEEGIWPASGSGNMMLWLTATNCQRHVVPGHENEGVHAVAGAFYVYAYGADTLRITPDLSRPVLPELAVVDCAPVLTELQEAAVGTAIFGEAGKGCNPCLGPCAPEPDCEVAPTLIDFGDVPTAQFREATFRIMNHGPGVLRGIVEGGCFYDFRVGDGKGFYTLEPGETHMVKVYFFPIFSVVRECEIHVANLCRPVLLRGRAIPPSSHRGPEDGIAVLGSPRGGSQTVRFRLAEPSSAALTVYDVSGRVVRRVLDEVLPAGDGQRSWDAGDLPSGVYFYHLEAGAESFTLKFVLVR
jgi:hypothetical protein